jgi:D-alanyl-D-alanine carboxypeptidase/D-alanyl-D-alanine-endopeptidase (penicillin-binding protein 4)
VLRRGVVPSVLLVVALVAGVLGVRAVPEASGAPEPPAAPPVAAPVLTARRVPVLLASPVGDRRLVAGLDALTAGLPDPSCLVVSEGDRVLYSRDPAAPVIPASTLKLVTAATVLAHLDASAQLVTTVRATAPVVDGVVAGDLWLVGGGDPVLGTEAWARTLPIQPPTRTPVEDLADRVVAAGVRVVQGRVVGDESRYDAVREVPSWPARYRAQLQVGPLSALTVNDAFAVSGGGRAPFAEPAVGAAGVLTEVLRARGVQVVGEPAAGTAPDGATELASVSSPPVLELVGQMLRDSDNGTAELLLKEVALGVAGTGSTAVGADLAERTLADLELPLAGVDVVDGSGLDRGNRVTCALLHDLLVALDAGGEVEGGLAVAGVTGTLARRYLDSPVNGRLRAKTGSLNNVAALAGYADTRSEGELTFSFVLNGLPPGADGTAAQDALADLLVAYPDVPDVAELGPGAWPGLGAPPA